MIRKTRRVKGKTLVFRNAQTLDATFILSLRTDSRKSMYLSQVTPELSRQVAWLESYASNPDQAYFIIENHAGEPFGTVRLYDAQGDSFCWGSWILKEGVPQAAAIESALMVYSYAIDQLGFRQSHFDVRKGNEKVWRFHERFGATRVGENEHNYLYRIAPEQISASRKRYRKYLPDSLKLEV